MNQKINLSILSFLQFFVWGAWLITIGNYWFGTQQWSPSNFGYVFVSLGISSIFMPPLTGILADKYINSEKLNALLHLFSSLAVLALITVSSPSQFLVLISIAMAFYMPTISLSYSIAYTNLRKSNLEPVKHFPPIRVWGTVGFIAAMWITNLSGNKSSSNMFVISSIAGIILALYSWFFIPSCPPQKIQGNKKTSIIEKLGFDSFKLFKDKRLAIFFLFSLFLGICLQLTNAYGDRFLSSFGDNPLYKDSFVVKYSTIIMSISQISETLFILAIPFFFKRFGIKQVILISILAWVLRFGLFSFGNPAEGLWMIILSNIIYGMAFDFFNISGSLYIERNSDSYIRASAQGLFMMMSNGFGAILGGWISGWLIENYFTLNNNQIDWKNVWLVFSIYALVVAVAFVFLFKSKNDKVIQA